MTEATPFLRNTILLSYDPRAFGRGTLSLRQYPYDGMHIVAVAASISAFLKKFFKYHFSGIGTHNTLKLRRNILARTLRSLKIARINCK